MTSQRFGTFAGSGTDNFGHDFGGTIRIPSSVILLGREPIVLSTRKQVLESAGMLVQTCTRPEMLQNLAGYVLVLCHTLSSAEQSQAAAQYHARFPSAGILIIGGPSLNFSAEKCTVLDQYPGPREFIRQVTQLMSRSQLRLVPDEA